MNINDLKPLNSLTKRYGVKCIMYGPPGSGKTPLMSTAPNPVALIVEPGLLSARTITNVMAVELNTFEKIEDFFKWFFESKDASKFDTLCIDSLTQLAEIYLKRELDRNKDGRRAYGEMSRNVKNQLDKLYYFPNKHAYLICKEGKDGESGKKKPYFPGQELNVYVPHLFDEVLHIGLESIPGFIQPVKAILTKENFDYVARDRSGNLNEYEEPNLTKLFEKCMR